MIFFVVIPSAKILKHKKNSDEFFFLVKDTRRFFSLFVHQQKNIHILYGFSCWLSATRTFPDFPQTCSENLQFLF